VVAHLPCPSGVGGALCALSRCRAERGNGDEESSLTRTHHARQDAWAGRGRSGRSRGAFPRQHRLDRLGRLGRTRRRSSAGDVLHAATSSSRSVDGGVVRTAPGVRNLEQVDAGHADGLPHRDVAAATCDGAAVQRGRGREAGVLMAARQGEARVVRMDTSAYM